MKIRKATPHDLERVYQFIRALEEKEFDFASFQALYLKNLANEEYCYLVAEEKDSAIGFISLHTQLLLHHGGRTGEIQELFVEEAHRGKGIGQRLIAEVERIGRSLQLIEMEVTPHRNRKSTHQFYQKVKYNHSHLKFTKPLL